MFDESEIDGRIKGQFSFGKRIPLSFDTGFRPGLRNLPPNHTSPQSSCQQFATRHPKIGQGEQGGELSGVFLQPTVAHLDEAELLLDHPERVLNLGPDARLDAFNFVNHDVDGIGQVQYRPLARAHGHMPFHVASRVRSFMRTLITSVPKDIGFRPMQQRVGFDYVMNVSRSSPDGVHQSRLGIRADVG